MDTSSVFPSLPAEVVRRICSQLLQEDSNLEFGADDRYPGLRTVATLARTAKVFHEQALDAIWHTLPGYGFLLYAVPRDAWVETEVQEPHWRKSIHVSLLRPLVESDFTRLQHYATRVRRILFPSQCESPRFPPRVNRYEFAPSILDAFASQSPIKPLLPNLLVLHTSPKPSQAESFYRSLPILFSPKLRSFNTKYSLSFQEVQSAHAPCDQSLRHMFTQLHEVAPRLTHLTVDLEYWPLPQAIRNTVSEAICQFQHLYGLFSVVPISLEAFTHLARLRSLRVLDARLDSKLVDEKDLAPLLEIPHNEFFPHLRQLHLAHQCHISLLTAMLRHVWSPWLMTIQVPVPSLREPLQQVKDCIAVIGRRRGRKKITRVYMNITPHYSNSPDTDSVDDDAILPLLKLKNLTELCLSLGYNFSLDDVICHAMAAAWRNIVVLKLGPYPEQKTSAVTLGALVSFAHLCPSLRRLNICLDADVKHLPWQLLALRPGCGKEQTALEVLEVGRSPIKDAVAVAGVLSDLFPNLCDVESAWDCDDGYSQEEYDGLTEEERERVLAETVFYKRWNDAILTLVPQFALVRKQEREWARMNGVALRPALDISV
ncbi:hypothetical protein K466DRAFT_160461 [Polyporus arcularius HHB13444]|uniref:F-box domain-containing protein n=1 Tax=Polyporus arcularius HHB13444 TaxID=1314778 RepID=A0A5C3PWH0_9APHY|nr:hypothetical protein K466DRAFT_160461 [Polyporus arcularius HHB13444]